MPTPENPIPTPVSIRGRGVLGLEMAGHIDDAEGLGAMPVGCE